MQLHTCLALPSGNSETPCPDQVVQPLPFCRIHFEQYCALKEAKASAALDAKRLSRTVEGMIKEGTDGYMRASDVRKDTEVVRWYLTALDKERDARETLKTRFFSSEENHAGETGLPAVEYGKAVTFITQLEAREVAIVAEEAYAEAAAKARALLREPHTPFTCDTCIPHGTLVNPKCPTIQMTTGKQCPWSPKHGHRVCQLHIMTHATSCNMHAFEMLTLERSRAEAARVRVGMGDVSSNIAIVRSYIRELERAMASRLKHQTTYSCEDIHEASLENFKRRRTSAVLLLAALNGREEVKIAVRQGEWERWTSEYLAEVKRLEEKANNELVGRLTVRWVQDSAPSLADPWVLGQ
ncbi:hypothetical protein C8Q74DRAFT_247347 [Fomes fomentarius]|nr:hypothetical protein C8Q74DRAFT_247347 [Fomes fomentarius]